MEKNKKVIPSEDEVREIATKVIDSLRSGDLSIDKLKAFYETEVPELVIVEEIKENVVDFKEIEILVNYDIDQFELINSAGFKSVAAPFKKITSEESLNGFSHTGLDIHSEDTGKKIKRFKPLPSYEVFNKNRNIYSSANLMEFVCYVKEMNSIEGLNGGRIMTTGFFVAYEGKDCYPAYSKEEGFFSISLLDSIFDCQVLAVPKNN